MFQGGHPLKWKRFPKDHAMGPIVLFLLVVSGFLSPPHVLASEVLESEFPRCPYDDLEKARATYGREIANLSSAGGRASRTGLRLTLRSRDRAVVLEDDCSSTESAVRHFFESHLADIGYFLVKADLYEGRAFLLVNDKTGNKTWLKGPPVVSPDNKRFVTASMDLEAGYNPNEIQVWRLEPSGPELESSANFGEQWGPSDPVWTDAETISFKKNVFDPGSPGQLLSTPAILRRKGNQWELHIPPQ
jgi:hypothetical protein